MLRMRAAPPGEAVGLRKCGRFREGFGAVLGPAWREVWAPRARPAQCGIRPPGSRMPAGGARRPSASRRPIPGARGRADVPGRLAAPLRPLARVAAFGPFGAGLARSSRLATPAATQSRPSRDGQSRRIRAFQATPAHAMAVASRTQIRPLFHPSRFSAQGNRTRHSERGVPSVYDARDRSRAFGLHLSFMYTDSSDR
ncbi:hypothetical protein DFLDMN_002497 [Cupriavidus sp. H19C3]